MQSFLCLFKKSIDGLIGNNFRMMFFFREGDVSLFIGDDVGQKQRRGDHQQDRVLCCELNQSMNISAI